MAKKNSNGRKKCRCGLVKGHDGYCLPKNVVKSIIRAKREKEKSQK